MTRKNSNCSNYHYRSETTDEEGNVKVKYHFTLQELCDEFQTSTFSIYRLLKKDIIPKQLKNTKIFKDYQPVQVKILNPKIIC